MNFTTSPAFAEALASLRACSGPRALLVTLDGDQLHTQPVHRGQSVLALSEIQSHLDAQPVEAEFLESLRDYCAGRLAARAEARRTGGFVIPRAPARWEIAHVNPIQSLEVVHA